MRLLLVILALVWAGLLVCVPAHANESTRVALAALCPGSEHLAEHVDEAAHRYLVPRLTIVAQIWCESRCRVGAIGRAGEVGLMQIHGVAANGLGLFELVQPRNNILTAARWLALRELDCGGQAAGLAGYNSRTCRGGRKYARRVLAVVQKVRKAIEAKGPKS